MKYALVTGGSRGIGRAVCIDLAKSGYNILINYNSNEAAALETKAEVEANGVVAELLPFNVSERAECSQAISGWVEANPDKQIAVLVNNAGIRKDNLFIWMEDKDWDEVLNISLGGFYNVTKAVLPTMVSKKWGRIINIVSLSGIKGLPGQTNYSASKAAVIGATKALAQEVGRRKITVNAVAPGFIKTDMTQDIDEKEHKSIIPLKRFGAPEEVASLVSFLASENSAYITGEVITISGGL
ncbi:3-oxoacyl-ACP reductase FabG [Flammeovirgaceae bacterium SG7u.111]|nr:3-oxoacyl-ACP reductase FabG [Flammeovirgaceae bacterium SG7u.132]WPO36168.1 3-oxoacyl-ACP reductase FabG [Flammeovirgaceae bacterium SG7u.111]